MRGIKCGHHDMLHVFTLDMGLKYVLYWSADYMFECYCVNEGYQMGLCVHSRHGPEVCAVLEC